MSDPDSVSESHIGMFHSIGVPIEKNLLTLQPANVQRWVALQQCELTAEALPLRATTAVGGRQTADERRETAVCGPPSVVFPKGTQS